MRRLKKTMTIAAAFVVSADGLVLTGSHVKFMGHKQLKQKYWTQNFLLSDSAAEKLGSNIGQGKAFNNLGAKGLSKLGMGVAEVGKGVAKLGKDVENGLTTIGYAFCVAAAALSLWTEVNVLKSFERSLFIQLLLSLVALKAVVFGIAAIGILFSTCIDSTRKTKKTNKRVTPSTSAGAKM